MTKMEDRIAKQLNRTPKLSKAQEDLKAKLPAKLKLTPEIIKDYREALRGLSAERLTPPAGSPKGTEVDYSGSQHKAQLDQMVATYPDLPYVAKLEVVEETRKYRAALVDAIVASDNVDEEKTRKLQKLDRAIVILDNHLDKLTKEDPAAYLAINTHRLGQMYDKLQAGRIVEVPAVRAVIDEGKENLFSTGSITLHGETGGGKTELARIIALEATGQEALVVRCFKGMPTTDLFGSKKLESSQNGDTAARLEKVTAEWAAYSEAHPGQSDELKAVALKALLDGNGVTVSTFVLGPIYKAAAEGRTVILDEFNTLPNSTLMSLNEILVKKPGEIITVQETGESIVVKQGFSVIKTANIDYGEKKYTDRVAVEASQTERSRLIHVGALPQQLAGNYTESTGIKDNQLFAIALTACLNNDKEFVAVPHGNDKSPLESVWRLSRLASITQLAFAGQIDTASPYSYKEGGSPVNIKTQIQISNRRLIQILDKWKKTGTHRTLDSIILKDVVLQSQDLKERKYLYQLAQAQGFFRQEDGWKDLTSISGIRDFEKLEGKPEDKDNKRILQVVKEIEVVEAIYGNRPKESAEFQNTKLAREAERQIKELGKKLEQYAKELGTACPPPAAA